jgi:CarD family transcriptional regulator, regulator of rRNA transcription
MPVPSVVFFVSIPKGAFTLSSKMSFKVGEKLVYPNHGVTVVEQIGESAIMGAGDTYYHLRLLANNSRLMVPIRNTDRVGLRRLYQQKEIKGLISLLEERVQKTHSDWKGRYRENLEKMKTGRLEDVAEVLKNLNEVSKKKSLSFREKKMYDRAKYVIVSEVAIVKGIDEIEAEKLIEKSLDKSLGILGGAVVPAGGH